MSSKYGKAILNKKQIDKIKKDFESTINMVFDDGKMEYYHVLTGMTSIMKILGYDFNYNLITKDIEIIDHVPYSNGFTINYQINDLH